VSERSIGEVRVDGSPAGGWRRTGHELAWGGVAAATAAMIVLLEPRTVLTLIVFATAFAISIWKPELGLAILVASVPLQDTWPAYLGSITLTWTRLLMLCVLVAWTVLVLCRRERVRISLLAWTAVAYVTALVATVANARDIGDWAGESYRWGVAAVVLIVASTVVQERRDRRWLLAALGLGIVGSFAVAVYQLWTRSGPETFNQRGLLRVYGFFGEPNPFAAYLEIAVLPFAAMVATAWWYRDGAISRPLVAISLTVGAIGTATLLLTQSRGGLLGLLTGIAIIVWYAAERPGRILVIGGSLFTVLVLTTPVGRDVREALGFDALFADKAQVTSKNFAVHERMAHWGAAFRMWQEKPLLGIGAGNVSERFRELTPEWRFRIPRGHAHNNYLQAAAQAGSIGLICYLALLVAALRQCRRNLLRAASAEERAICTGALAVTAALAVHGMFEYTHVLSLGIPLGIIWAAASSIDLVQTRETALHGHD